MSSHRRAYQPPAHAAPQTTPPKRSRLLCEDGPPRTAAEFYLTDEVVLREMRLAQTNADRDKDERTKRTYVVTGYMGLDHAHLREVMRGHGWREVPVTSASADFVWAELYLSRFDPRSYNDDRKRCVTDKALLHELLAERFPEVAARQTARTRPLSAVASVAEGEVLILRPSGQWARAGNGIVRVSSTAELREARARMLARLPDAIASSYVVDHLLWQGRKFHVRMYWLVCAPCGQRPFTWDVWRRGKILCAAKPFVRGDWWDRAVHDTHVKSTPRNLFFPQDLGLSAQDAEAVYQSARAVLGCAAELLRADAVPYSESRYAYEVFGADFLVLADLRALLMEVNERIGFACIGDDADGAYSEFTRQYYEWVYDTAIGPMAEAASARSEVL
eukprot:m51a1_g1659 hypothetical protein (390) ;mRNA; r:369594-371116